MDLLYFFSENIAWFNEVFLLKNLFPLSHYFFPYLFWLLCFMINVLFTCFGPFEYLLSVFKSRILKCPLETHQLSSRAMILQVCSMNQPCQHSQMLVRHTGPRASPRSSESTFLVAGPGVCILMPSPLIFIHVEVWEALKSVGWSAWMISLEEFCMSVSLCPFS